MSYESQPALGYVLLGEGSILCPYYITNANHINHLASPFATLHNIRHYSQRFLRPANMMFRTRKPQSNDRNDRSPSRSRRFLGALKRGITPNASTTNLAVEETAPQNADIHPSTSVPMQSLTPEPEASHSLSESVGSNAKRESPMELAIKRLNTSIERLSKVTNVLNAGNSASEIGNGKQPSELDVTNVDSEIEKVSLLADGLLAKQKEAKSVEENDRRLVPETVRFVKTTCQTVAPAAKTILIALSKVSSSVMLTVVRD